MNMDTLKNDILVFDFDGVLTRFDFPAFNCKCWAPQDWIAVNLMDNPYKKVSRITLFDKMIKEKKTEELFVLSTALCSAEQNNKISYLKEHYPNIANDQMYFVGRDEYKKYVLLAMRKAIDGIYGHDKQISMIEDSASIMMDIEKLRRPNIRCYMLSDFIG